MIKYEYKISSDNLGYYEFFGDITDILKDLMGNSVKSAKISMGILFENEINILTGLPNIKDINDQIIKDTLNENCEKYERSLSEIRNMYEVSKNLGCHSDKEIQIIFETGNSVNISTLDYLCIEKGGK